MSTADVILRVLTGGSLVVAVWAALTAHRARKWQQQRHAEQRATRVRVEVATHAVQPMPNYPLFMIGDQVSPPAPMVYTLGVAVINDGEVTEYVTGVFITSAATADDGTRQGLRVFGSEGDEPTPHHELAPRNCMRVPVLVDTDNVPWMREGFVVEAWLASGPRPESPVEQLLPELLDDFSS